MTAYTVYLEQLPDLLQAWSEKTEVYVPTKNIHGFFDFTRWKPGTEIAWNYDQAYNPLKRFFLPPREDLITFDRTDYTAEPVFEAPNQLLFGVHPYDIRAVNQLDQLMESGSPDQNYLKRREATTIFGLDPLTVAESAFWATIGAERADIGYDLYWTKIGPTSFYVEVGSPKGEEMLLTKGKLEKATLTERETAKRRQNQIRAEARKDGLRYPWKETAKLLSANWDSPIWLQKARYCLSCGSCVLVCPTCYCFEVREEADVTLKKGTRFREWDGCMLPSFALVAGNHNFRPQPMERYRHRYFRKGKYIYDKIGELGCVGCGRCVRACTARIANPMAVYNELWEAREHES